MDIHEERATPSNRAGQGAAACRTACPCAWPASEGVRNALPREAWAVVALPGVPRTPSALLATRGETKLKRELLVWMKAPRLAAGPLVKRAGC